jgi:BirA family biotin operon repressor/biotin-[acetyl-CoA-carboxylase] ligase
VTTPNWSLIAAARESKRALPAARVASILAGADLDAELGAFSRRGYRFERSESGALRFAAWPRRLFAEEITTDLGADLVGRRVELHWKVTSTSDMARDAAARGREGRVILAEEQEAGRGRFGRRWLAPRFSSLLFSVPLRAPEGSGGPEGLMLAGAVAVAEAVDETLGVEALIRWPNDVFVDERKVAGVLVEGFQAGGERWFVTGVGVNVNFDGAMPQAIRRTAASLDEFAGRVDRALLLRAILRRLDFWWDVLKAGDMPRLSERWRALSSIIGRFIDVESGGKRFRGRVVDLDAHCGLVLRRDARL